MRILIISTLVLFPWLIAAPSAATIYGTTGPGGPNGICVPSETNRVPCGTGWTESQTLQFRNEHPSKPNGIGRGRGDRQEGVRGSAGNRGGHGGSHGSGHGGAHGGSGRR